MQKQFMELWKQIASHPGYEVSNEGRVRSVPRTKIYQKQDGPVEYRLKGRILRTHVTARGYETVVLGYRNEPILVHRLVAQTFIPTGHDGLAVNHKDGDKRNNRVGNLEWVSYSENTRHAISNGLFAKAKAGAWILPPDSIRAIRFFYTKKSRKTLSRVFERTEDTIRNIAAKRTYSWIP